MTRSRLLRLGRVNVTRWCDAPEPEHEAYVTRLWNGVVQTNPDGTQEERGGIKYVADAKGLSEQVVHIWMDFVSSGRRPPSIPRRSQDLLLELAKKGGIDLSPRPTYDIPAKPGSPYEPAFRVYTRLRAVLAVASLALCGFLAVSFLVPLPFPTVPIDLPALVSFVGIIVLAEVFILSDQNATVRLGAAH